MAPLDHNHTHFLLLDNGTEGKFGQEIKFRSLLEDFISNRVETGVAEGQSEYPYQPGMPCPAELFVAQCTIAMANCHKPEIFVLRREHKENLVVLFVISL